MAEFLKYTQTLIGSKRSTIVYSNINQRKPKYQLGKYIYFCISFWLVLLTISLAAPTAFAITDPLAVPNNRFGIHIISPTPQESSPAADLVNNNGDWGYITVLIENKDKNVGKWQEFFNDLRKRHLIPLVRIATEPDGGNWKRPHETAEENWADFLDKLVWPTKNRYVIIYNEPNHGQEWGGTVDARDYAKTLDKTITALKNKNPDFFVLNAGFDASAPQKLPAYQDQLTYMREMNEEVPGIFNKLDGWVSHSYPNPGFVSSPSANGRGTVRTYLWEMQTLRQLGVTKNLPIFIGETGWKHSEGKEFDPNLPSVELVSQYYQNAFQNAWTDPRIVAVTPFLLNYQDHPFDHFSFKKYTGEGQDPKILGLEYPEYHPFYKSIADLPKVQGLPVQEDKAQLSKGAVYTTLVAGETYNISLTFKNTGQSIWNERESISLVALKGGSELELKPQFIPRDTKVEPGQEYTFHLTMTAPKSGSYDVALNLFAGNKEFETPQVKFHTDIKTPVILKIKAGLGWKSDYAGDYLLIVNGVAGSTRQKVTLDKEGNSEEFEAKYLLPNYSFDFTLSRPFYKGKTITQKVDSGVNDLTFGELQPDIPSVIFNPKVLWQILPFSN